MNTRGRMLTISATYGAGGTIVGPRVAELVGLPFANRLSDRGKLPPLPSESATEDELDEMPRSRFLDGLALLSADWNIPAPADPRDLPDHVRAGLSASLESLIASGGAVVLGRAAAIALGRRPGVFHVRLDGPVERRAERGARWEGIDLDTARKRLEETDTARARYVRSLYRIDPADPALYHLVLDSTVLSVESCAELVASAARAAWGSNRLTEHDLVD